MKKISKYITEHYILVLIISLILIIPALIGYINTRINYDILIYLPDNIETIKGEKILTKDFGLGSYAFVMIDMKNNNKVLSLEKDIKKIKGVNKVFSIADVLGTTIPKDMLPDEVLDKLYNKGNNSSITIRGNNRFFYILIS